MPEALHNFMVLDFAPLLAGLLAAVSCGLLGNFLVLRKLSLMGDAISHSVLPGLVIAFLIAQSRAPVPMLLGALAAGVATVVLVELLKRLGKLEPGAAMGVVFSVLFALGVLLLEHGALRGMDLDADCVLHGQIEYRIWAAAPADLTAYLSIETWATAPVQLRILLISLVVSAVFVTLFFKELRISSFDPQASTAAGISAPVMHYALMIVVAVATVASFEAVGSILVIAMLICPAATARLLTDRLKSQLWVSVGVAATSAVGGYYAGAFVPRLFGLDAVNAAGAITVVSGLLLLLAVLFSPWHGVIARAVRRRKVRRDVLRDDLLGALYRIEESGEGGANLADLRAVLGSGAQLAVRTASRQGLVAGEGERVGLTEKGRAESAGLIRRHRLWEHYLVGEAGFRPDHVHETAERLEHLREETPRKGPDSDPHGRPIPPESEAEGTGPDRPGA